jgi:hypothetical protein
MAPLNLPKTTPKADIVTNARFIALHQETTATRLARSLGAEYAI